ncbi:DUF5719 family protein [Microbacterium sp. KHB019]|uniref:DUF5719 family protein n=1 Tax=Microbacterium sp. KHB019 TaxID=3129770 RepID=UPI00307A309E
MIQNRAVRLVATGARFLTGAALAVGCVVAVVIAVALPWPGAQSEPAQVSVTPTAGDTTLVCSGEFRALGRNPADAAQQMSAGTPSLTVGSTGVLADSVLAAPEIGESSGPKRFVGSAEQGGAALVAAAESLTLAADDLSGLAASACRETRTESWLVGGTVETGTSDLIILSNPGDVTATATLTVFGPTETSTTALVPAGTQVTVPLSSVAAGTPSPVVRVTAQGAPLRAELQSSLIRTLDPSGIDIQDSAAAPNARIGFAGIQVLDTSEDTALTLLRLMATDQATKARIVVRSNGTEVMQTSVPLDARIPAEVNLDQLEPGVYSIDIEADASVVGAVRQTTGAGAGSDFAWTPSAPELRGEVFVAVPSGPSPRLHLANSSEADASITLNPAAGGAAQEITIPAGGDSVVDVRADRVYALTTDQPVRAAVMLSGTDALAGWPVWPGAAAQEAIIVYP